MKWSNETLNRYPNTFEQSTENTYIWRKDIVEHVETHEGIDEEGKPVTYETTYYTCKMAIITNEEYASIISTQQLPTDNIHIKEALADIYIELLSKQ